MSALFKQWLACRQNGGMSLSFVELMREIERSEREEEKVYCFGCDEDVPVDEYDHLKELCNSCIDRGR